MPRLERCDRKMPPKVEQQHRFPQLLLDVHEEISVDLFAGGGGASEGFYRATGRHVDIAINHDAAAIEMHKANHPTTLHLKSDVYEVDPYLVCQGRPVGLLWASPDCTGFSKAKGGKPRREKDRKRRALAWVVVRWAGTVRPRVIHLENVEEFTQWTRLVGAPDNLRECKKTRGRRFKRFVRLLRELGYQVEWREMRACDYGAPTIRKRLFLIARRDGQPIVWPEPTHGDPESEEVRIGKRLPWRTAAECIDWDIPMCSIFASKEEAVQWGKRHNRRTPQRPLKPNTERRIARGVHRFVLESNDPFLMRQGPDGKWSRTAAADVDRELGGAMAPLSVDVAHGEESPKGKRRGKGSRSLREPHGTVTCCGSTAIVAPTLVNVANGGTTGRAPNTWSIGEPLRTIPTSNPFALLFPYLGGVGGRAGQSMERSVAGPFGTTTAKADLALFAPLVMKNNHGDKPFYAVSGPLHTVLAGACHHCLLAAQINPITHAGDRVPRSAGLPMATVTCANRGELSLLATCLVPRYGERVGQDPRCRSLGLPFPSVVPTGNGGFLCGAHVATYYGAKGFADARGQDLRQPLRTQGCENRHALVVSSFFAQNNEGFYKGWGRGAGMPMSTILNEGANQSLIVVGLSKLRGTSSVADPKWPLHTASAGGQHHGLFCVHICRDFGNSVGQSVGSPLGTVTAGGGGKAALVGSFLDKYYGTGEGQDLNGPLHTIPTVDRFSLVSVFLGRVRFVITDILMRMLRARELYRAQGFSDSYIIDRGADGRTLTETEQVRMVGNSVCPPVAEALIRANCPELIARPELRKAVALAS